jgi:hypothetical protein
MAYKIRKQRKWHTKKWERCVKKVKRKSKSVNPFAVCTSRLGRKSFTTK